MSFIRPALEAIHNKYPPSVGEPESRNTLMLATQTPLMVVTTFVVGLRILSRACLTVSRVEYDDWLILAATVCSIGLYTTNIISIRYGWGLHIWDTQIDLLEPAQKTVLANEILFTFTAGLTKLSILAFYLRVFSAYERFRYWGWGGLFYVSSYMLSSTIAAFAQCTPLRAFWLVSTAALVLGVFSLTGYDSLRVTDIKDFKCNNMYAAIMALTALNSLSDIYIFAIPIPWVWKLRLPAKQRIGLIITFGLALVACIVGVIRIKYLKLAVHDSPDITWHGALAYILCLFEADLGIICASLPALRPLFARIFPSKPRGARSVKEISRVWRKLNIGVFDSRAAEVKVSVATTASTCHTGDLSRKDSKEDIRLDVRTAHEEGDAESV